MFVASYVCIALLFYFNFFWRGVSFRGVVVVVVQFDANIWLINAQSDFEYGHCISYVIGSNIDFM